MYSVLLSSTTFRQDEDACAVQQLGNANVLFNNSAYLSHLPICGQRTTGNNSVPRTTIPHRDAQEIVEYDYIHDEKPCSAIKYGELTDPMGAAAVCMSSDTRGSAILNKARVERLGIVLVEEGWHLLESVRQPEPIRLQRVGNRQFNWWRPQGISMTLMRVNQP